MRVGEVNGREGGRREDEERKSLRREVHLNREGRRERVRVKVKMWEKKRVI